MSTKAGTVKSLSSASLDPMTVRVKLQEMRPLVKDPHANYIIFHRCLTSLYTVFGYFKYLLESKSHPPKKVILF